MQAKPLTHELIERLVKRALRAPSADNHHPFRWQWDGSCRLYLLADPEFEHADIGRRFLGWYAVGCLSETLAIAASEEGWSVTAQYQPERTSGVLCEWTFSERSVAADPLAQAIERRHTNRKPYQRAPLEPELLAQLERECASVPGAHVQFLAGGARKPLLGLMRIAEAERFASQPLHAEIFDSIRFDVGWKATTDRGIPPVATEVELPMRPLFAVLRHWPVMRLANLIGTSSILGVRVAWFPGWASAALGVITADSTRPEDALQTGRALQRIWLRATLLGLSMQPLAASAILRLPWWPGVRKETKAKMAEQWYELTGERQPLMVFRLGLASEPSGVAARPASVQIENVL